MSFQNLQTGLPTRVILAFTLLFSLALVGCSGYSSVLAPASAEAAKLADLFWGVIWAAVAIFVLVEGLLILALVRFRDRPGAAEPRQDHGNLRLEIAWTIAPGFVVVGLFWATVQTMGAVTQPQPDPLRVKVVGYQWWWQIDYPDLRITTATDMHVPVGRPVVVELIAGDVIHSFWAPALFGKTDVLPGRSTWAQFTAHEAGVFRGQCAEFCGAQHANMGFLVVAEPVDHFERWVKGMQSPAPPDQSLPGAQAFRACFGCHTVQGTPAQGKIGPDLTHFGGRQSIAALTLANTPENLASWLADPQAVKPDSKMPNLRLSQETIRDLVAFLERLK